MKIIPNDSRVGVSGKKKLRAVHIAKVMRRAISIFELNFMFSPNG